MISPVNKDIAGDQALQFVGKVRLMIEAVECAKVNEKPMQFCTFYERTREHLELFDAAIKPTKATKKLKGGTDQ